MLSTLPSLDQWCRATGHAAPNQLFPDWLDGSSEALTAGYLARLLQVARTYLSMEVAFIAEFTEGRRVFRYVDAEAGVSVVEVGASDALADSYCQHVIEGRLPQLICNAQMLPFAQTLPATAALPVGAHISVPLLLRDGRLYGTFCCFSRTPNTALTERDLAAMRGFSELASDWIDSAVRHTENRRSIQDRVQTALAGRSLHMRFQPICMVSDNRIVGFEALATFDCEPPRPPNLWFQEAQCVGLGDRLESEAVRLALTALSALPPSFYMTINISPEFLLQADLAVLLKDHPLDRLVIEVTEHAAIEHYEDIASRLAPLRDEGLRIAVDDAGAGYASFRHILNLAPDIIKLDISLTRGIDTDLSRRALAAALITFGTATGAHVVAEGVETEAELAALRALGAEQVQGFLIGRPLPLREALAALRGPLRRH